MVADGDSLRIGFFPLRIIVASCDVTAPSPFKWYTSSTGSRLTDISRARYASSSFSLSTRSVSHFLSSWSTHTAELASSRCCLSSFSCLAIRFFSISSRSCSSRFRRHWLHVRRVARLGIPWLVCLAHWIRRILPRGQAHHGPQRRVGRLHSRGLRHQSSTLRQRQKPVSRISDNSQPVT